MRNIASTLFVLMALGAPAAAQELTVSVAAYRSFGLDDLDGELPMQTEFRVAFALSDRFALEPFVDVIVRPELRPHGPKGLYGIQVRQRIRALTGERTSAFATYGAAGAYSSAGVDPPIAGTFGFGMRRKIGAHLLFRPEVQLLTFHVVPIGARVVAGISVGAQR